MAEEAIAVESAPSPQGVRVRRPRRLAVVPTDPLEVYAAKGIGNWLADYYNPLRFFDEVYCLSPWESRRRRAYGMRILPTPAPRFAERVRELGVDLVRAYGGYDACDLACLNKVPGVPVVVSVHDTNPDLLHDSILQADHVLAVSQAVRDLLIRRGVAPERVHQFANRVDLDLFRPVQDQRLRSEFMRRFPGRYRIVQVGRKTRQKNPDTLIRALALLGPEYVGLLIGPGDEEPYRALAQECGVEQRCHLIQSVANTELPQYYSFSDCMCTPSRWEGFGIVFIEALACGAVVVTSDIAPMNEYITSGRSGLLVKDYEDPAALAEAIRRACTDQALRRELQSHARAAAEPFSKPVVDRMEVSLYQRFLDAKEAGAAAGTAQVHVPTSDRRAYYLSRLEIFRILTEADLHDPAQRSSPEIVQRLQAAGLERPDLTSYWQRVEFIVRHVRGRVLELGCGCGNMTRYICRARDVSAVVAIDMMPEFVEVLRGLGLPNVEAVCGDVCDAHVAGPFDCVVMAELLEHLTETEERRLLERIHPLLTADARWIITTPIGMMPDPDHVRGLSRAEFTEHLRRYYGLPELLEDNGIQQFAVVQARTVGQSAGRDAPVASGNGGERSAKEREKWDRVFHAYEPRESEPLRASGAEFAELVAQLLPSGARVLEAGCGPGYQSLALARLRRFDIHVLDFSERALEAARSLFAANGAEATFHLEDFSKDGAPEYELVFNAGVLEHYSFDEQVALLRGMASRSRNFVVAMVPNRACYWYWLWRIEEASCGAWPYGKEAPLWDLRPAFEAAGLRFLGQTYLGEAWTEVFVRNLRGIEEPLKERVLQVHRSALIPTPHKAYLLAGLGTVSRSRKRVPVAWQVSPAVQMREQADANGALADALALRIQAEGELAELRRTLDRALAAQGALSNQLADQRRTVADLTAALTAARQEIQAQAELRERLLREEREQREHEARTLSAGLAAARQEAQLQAELHERLLREEREQREHEARTLSAALAAARQEAQLQAALRQSYEQKLAQRDADLAGAWAELEQRLAELREAQSHSERLGARLAAHEAFLSELYSSIGWVLLQRLHRLRQFVAPDGGWRHRALRRSWAGARRGYSAVRSGGRRLMARLCRLGLPAPMSWYAYAFDRYKRRRSRGQARDLGAIGCPGEPGLVSVVLPVYNGADYLREALDSVLAQTYRRLELIVVDDGSTDDTPHILAQYAARDDRVRVLTQPNLKLPRALSNGFRAARGEFLTWTSADNRLKPEFLAHLVANLRRRPAYDVVYGDQDIIGPDGRRLENAAWFADYQRPLGSGHVYLPIDPSELNVWPNNYVGAAFLYRARVPYLIGEYSPRLFGLEDYDYWMRANALLTLRHADHEGPLYDYRFHDQSLTAADERIGITRRRQQLMVFEDFRRNFCCDPLIWCLDAQNRPASQVATLNRLRARIRAARHIELTRELLEAGDTSWLWQPSIYVRLAGQGEALPSPPAGLPESTLRVLLWADTTALPEDVPSTWDLCAATASGLTPVRLAHPWQGWLVIPDPATLFTALDIRCRSAHLTRIEAQSADPVPSRFAASIIICAYWRADRLKRAIEAVARQAVSPETYEVIVVNNAPADQAVPRLVSELRQTHFRGQENRLKLVTCHVPGLSHARNAGLAEASGDVLCFLDDDAVPQEGWLAALLQAFAEHPDAGVIGGRILLKTPNPPPTWLRPDAWPCWSHFDPPYERYTPVSHWWEFPWGANWAARRQALMAIGGFRTAYGRKGMDFGGGEELVAARLIQSLGYTVAVEPRSAVVHDVEPERFTLQHVKRSIPAGVRVAYRCQTDLYLPMEASLVHYARQAVEYGLRALARGLPPGERARRFSYARAYGGVFVEHLRDLLLRCRRPVALRR